MHPRISLHQVAMIADGTPAFVEHCRDLGVKMTLVTPVLMQTGALAEAQAALAAGGDVHTVNHPVARDLAGDPQPATDGLLRAIDIAAALGAPTIYLVTGGRGGLSWEEAAERFAAILDPCLAPACAKNVRLTVETASDFNVDIHIAHTLDDTVTLAQIAGIDVCVELHACWFEARLKEKLARAIPKAGLVQVSDYVAGDRTAPCRAVPGDGMIPLERILGDILELGYEGVFDLELIGPRIEAEGPRQASRRAAEYLSELLTRLGA